MEKGSPRIFHVSFLMFWHIAVQYKNQLTMVDNTHNVLVCVSQASVFVEITGSTVIC